MFHRLEKQQLLRRRRRKQLHATCSRSSFHSGRRRQVTAHALWLSAVVHAQHPSKFVCCRCDGCHMRTVTAQRAGEKDAAHGRWRKRRGNASRLGGVQHVEQWQSTALGLSQMLLLAKATNGRRAHAENRRFTSFESEARRLEPLPEPLSERTGWGCSAVAVAAARRSRHAQCRKFRWKRLPAGWRRRCLCRRWLAVLAIQAEDRSGLLVLRAPRRAPPSRLRATRARLSWPNSPFNGGKRELCRAALRRRVARAPRQTHMPFGKIVRMMPPGVAHDGATLRPLAPASA